MAPTLPISVVIPAYNRAGQIGRALESVARQWERPAEVIVVDDASTDETGAVAEAHGARVMRHETNRGAVRARDTGAAAATHDWVALLDSDDEWLPWHLSALWRRRDGHVLVAGSALRCGEGRDRLHGPSTWRDIVLTSPEPLVWPENFVVASAAIAQRDAYRRALALVDERWSEDFGCWLRMLERGTGLCLAEVTAMHYVHEGGKARARAEAGAAQERLARSAPVRRSKVERRIGARGWDELRATRAGDVRGILKIVRTILGHPQRPVGVVAMIVHRRMLDRRTAAVAPDGRLRVLSRGGAGVPDDRLSYEPLGARRLGSRLKLLIAPPAAVIGAGPLLRFAMAALRRLEGEPSIHRRAPGAEAVDEGPLRRLLG